MPNRAMLRPCQFSLDYICAGLPLLYLASSSQSDCLFVRVLAFVLGKPQTDSILGVSHASSLFKSLEAEAFYFTVLFVNMRCEGRDCVF